MTNITATMLAPPTSSFLLTVPKSSCPPSLCLQHDTTFDPDFYARVERVSRDKLRKQYAPSVEAVSTEFTREALLSSRSSPHAATAYVSYSPARNQSQDTLRYRTLVRLSYQKAKVCVQILSRPPPPPPSPELSAMRSDTKMDAMSLAPNGIGGTVSGAERRGRSRSNSFMVRPGQWRPSAAQFVLSQSAPESSKGSRSVLMTVSEVL